jgi:hypothetical protein
MDTPPIQHLGLYFSGFFMYDETMIHRRELFDAFAYDDYFRENEAYFRQKYYPNWLQTLYPDKVKLTQAGLSSLENNQLYIKGVDEAKEYSCTAGGRVFTFRIGKIGVHLFREGLGIFSIKVQLSAANLNFEDLSLLSGVLRNTTINDKFSNSNPLIEVIERDIVPWLSSDPHNWRNFTPHLKVFMNIDMKAAFPSEETLDNILFDLATFSPIGTAGGNGLYTPSEGYYNEILKDNTIHLFRNWKVISLFDSVIRISVNLQDVDRYNLWENDYFTIYIFCAFIRFYLFRINARLAKNMYNVRHSEEVRNDFIRFMNDFDLTQISYKFLPNIIYRDLLRAFEVNGELRLLEQKIARIDTSIHESKEKKIEALLAFIAVLSILTSIFDGTELIHNQIEFWDKGLVYFSITAGLTVFIVLVVGWIYLSRRKRR